jgi:oxygen-dependent protoporphyrinogen oxidase
MFHAESAAAMLDGSRPHVVVIGGGITGMSAAYELQHSVGVRVSLVERCGRLGGKIVTERVEHGGEFVVEGGPDSFVAQKPWAIELAHRLGIAGQLQGSAAMRPATMVLKRGRLHPLPEGVMLVVPTRMGPFVRTGLISPLGKLRMALDLVIPARRGEGDESLAAFIQRRLGREALDTLAEPLMAGIHSAESGRQSMLATFPRFREMERAHGSLIRAMRATRRAAPKASGQPAGQPWSGAPFVTLHGGIAALSDALAAALSCDILLGCEAAAIERGLGGQGYRVRLGDGRALAADAVLVTTPAYSAAGLLADLAPELAEQLRAIPYVSTATISLAYDERDLRAALPGYGVIIPRGEGRRINACTISSRKFAGRAPGGTLLVRAFVGGARSPEALALDDEALLALARAEIGDILGLAQSATPLFGRVYRWERGSPQYEVGHLQRVEALARACPDGVWLAGAAYRGVGIPDCIKQGFDAAQAALASIRASARAGV